MGYLGARGGWVLSYLGAHNSRQGCDIVIETASEQELEVTGMMLKVDPLEG